MTSPRASGEAGAEESPGAAGEPDSSSESTAEQAPRTPAAGAPTPSEPPESAGAAEPPGAEPSAEARPATGIRWSQTGETPAAAGAPAHPDPDDDPTPPSGIPAGQTAPGTWPHPGFPHQAPPTWQQTAPGWAPPATRPRDPARRRRVRRILLGILLGIIVAAAVVVALLAFLVGPRFARYDVLDRAAVERGVGDVVTRDWHRQVAGVTCPDDVRVRPNTSFSCTATVDGRPQQVPVDVVDQNGTYEVGQPR